MRKVNNELLREGLTLQKLFTKSKPPVLIPHSPNTLLIRKPDDNNSNFINIANKVLLKNGLTSIDKITTDRPQQHSQITIPKNLPQYAPIIYEQPPQLSKTEPLDIKLDSYLSQLTDDDIKILKRRNLPYLPSQYTRSPNYVWPGPDVPFVKKKSDIKGVLVPFLGDYKQSRNVLLRNVQFQIYNNYFSLKFIPADHIAAVGRKSKPSLMVQPSYQLLFNKFGNLKLSSKTTSLDYFPSNISTQRRRTSDFYKKLYWNYLQGTEQIKDGILVIKCRKLLNSVEDFKKAEFLFKKSIEPVHTMRVITKRRILPRELESTCRQYGLPYEKLFANFL